MSGAGGAVLDVDRGRRQRSVSGDPVANLHGGRQLVGRVEFSGDDIDYRRGNVRRVGFDDVADYTLTGDGCLGVVGVQRQSSQNRRITYFDRRR